MFLCFLSLSPCFNRKLLVLTIKNHKNHKKCGDETLGLLSMLLLQAPGRAGAGVPLQPSGGRLLWKNWTYY
jgi:hypothetical protein